MTQGSYQHVPPSAGASTDDTNVPILSPRLLFGLRTIVLPDLITLLGNERLCGVVVKGNSATTLLGSKA